MEQSEERMWALILHLSQLAGHITFGAGFVAPIVIWLVYKDKSSYVDEHGRMVVNWVISFLIYLTIAIVLVLFLIGIPILIALEIIAVIYPIVGGIKAYNGETWKYYGAIPFL